MSGGCFIDIMLYSSENYHQEHSREPMRLAKDVLAAWGAVMFPQSCHSVVVLICGHGSEQKYGRHNSNKENVVCFGESKQSVTFSCGRLTLEVWCIALDKACS